MNNVMNTSQSNGNNGYNQSNGNNQQPIVNKNQMQNNNGNHNNTTNNGNIEVLGSQTWQSLKKLYGQNTSEEERSAADKFLSKYLPNQPCCWLIFARFLSTDNVPHDVHFFAANMLRSKIQRNLHQVPRNEYKGLHDTIITALITFSTKGDSYENVRTQLSIGLALLAIQHTEEWNQVPYIINQLAKTETLDILLNILTRLAEELYTFHIPISPKIKQIASNNLRNHASDVLRLLHDLFKMVETNNLSNKTKIKLKIFKCFAAWLDFMDTHFKDFMKNYSVLTQICFSSLDNADLFKEACSCISKILRLSDGDTRRYIDEHKEGDNAEINSLMKKQFNLLIPNILKLREMYKHSVTCADTEKCYGLTRLFVDTAEKYVDWIIEQSFSCKECRDLIQMVVDCSGHSDPQISTYVCVFWERLCSPFISMAREYKRQHGSSAHEVYDDFTRPWPDWALPYVWYNKNDNNLGLIPSIIPNTVRSAKLPIDFEDMDADEQEDAMQLRWQLSDVIADICNIIGLNNVLDILSGLLLQFSSGNNKDVLDCEAVLFCIRSTFHSSANASESHPLYRILCQLRSLDCSIVIRRTAVQLISCHCSFLMLNESRHKELFCSLYEYILSSLSFDVIQRDCVGAILCICCEFPAHLFPASFIQSLFTIYDNIDSYNLNTRDELSIIEAMTILISTFSNESMINQAMNHILQKPTHYLSSSVLSADPVSVNESALYHTMNCISSVFKYFKPSNKSLSYISVSLLERMWCSIKFILMKYTDKDGVMEKTTRIIKHVIRNGGHTQFMQSKLCIESLHLLTDLYCNKSQRSSFLYIIWIYVDEYIEETPSSAQQLMFTLLEITKCTFNILKGNDECFNSLSDIVEDFYELLAQYMKKAPKLIVENDKFNCYFEQIFVLAQFGLLMDQTKPHEAICNFFIDTAYLAQNTNPLFKRYGNQIILKILKGLSGQVRYQRAICLANLLNQLYKFNKELFKQLIINQMQQIKIQSKYPSKQEFMNEFFDKESDSNKRNSICIDWFYACERYLRSRTF